MNKKKIGLLLNIVVPGIGNVINKQKTGIIQLAISLFDIILVLFIYSRLSHGSTIQEMFPLLILVYVIYDINLLWSLLVNAKLLEPKKDIFFSFLSFTLSTGFMVPLFNIGLCFVSILVALKALKLIDKDSKHYGGLLYAYLGLAISASMLIVTLIFLFMFAYRKLTCQAIASTTLF